MRRDKYNYNYLYSCKIGVLFKKFKLRISKSKYRIRFTSLVKENQFRSHIPSIWYIYKAKMPFFKNNRILCAFFYSKVCLYENKPYLCNALERKGQLPEWPNGSDCNSDSLRLRWFESITAHYLFAKVAQLIEH